MSKEPNKFLQNALSEINNDISPSGEDENDYLISSKKKAKNDSLLDQDVQDRINYRGLKTKTLYFIMSITSVNILVTLGLLIAHPIVFYKFGFNIYSEKFLAFLLGSQLVVMPFVLLQIITKHLFPNNKQ